MNWTKIRSAVFQLQCIHRVCICRFSLSSFLLFSHPPTHALSLSLPPILIICYMSHFLFRKLYTTVLYIRLYLVTDYACSVHRVPKSESAHNYYRMSRLTRNRDLSWKQQYESERAAYVIRELFSERVIKSADCENVGKHVAVINERKFQLERETFENNDEPTKIWQNIVVTSATQKKNCFSNPAKILNVSVLNCFLYLLEN